VTKQATIKDVNLKVNKLAEFVTNQTSTLRRQVGSFLGLSHNGKRDIYDIYGYPTTLDGGGGYSMMYKYARRQGIANRICFGLPKRCWRDGFEVYESAEDDANPILVEEVNALKKAKIFSKMEAVDILNRIGRMAVLYVGIPDGKGPEEPLEATSLGPDWLDKVYFVAYPYDGIEISSQVQDPTNYRYGLPEKYSLSRGQSVDNGKDTSFKSITAHWSRCVHLNENGLTSDIEGMGALESVLNSILDIEKATGGASEAYFRNARQKIGYELDPSFAASFLKDDKMKEAFDEKAKEFTNQQQDHVFSSGSVIKPIQVTHASPLDTVKVALWNISAQTGFPIRILTGEGSGQLAGSEDQLAYNQIVRDRQNVKCSEWADGVLTILANAGMLDLPEGYEIRFPPQESATEKEIAEVGNKKANTLKLVMDSASTPAGDGINVESALNEMGLKEVEYDESAIDELDREIDALTEPDQNATDREELE
jgi:hypothetical protein